MIARLARFALVWCFPFVFCCATPEPPPDPEDPEDGDLIEGDGEWRVAGDPAAARFIVSDRPRATGGSGVLGRSARLAHDFLTSRRDLFGPAMTSANLELRSVAGDPLGGARVAFAVRIGGLRVDGGEVVVAIGPDGRVRATAGWFPGSAALLAAPTVDLGTASRTALEHASVRWPENTIELEERGELVALPLPTERLRPCWRFVIAGEGGDGLFRRELFIDAETGAVVHEREGLLGAGATGSGLGVDRKRKVFTVEQLTGGTYRLEDRSRNVRTMTAGGRATVAGNVVTSADPHRWDEHVVGAGAAVDAHVHAGIVVDFLAQRLRRDSWDGQGGRVSLVVHYGEGVTNAFWDGRRAFFGDGDGADTVPYAAALDVVAHELFHGVVQEEAGLVYEREPGALSESLSDVFGILVEGQNWLLGEDLGAVPLRDVEAPWTLDQPSHMREYVQLAATPASDMGGVHVNSTIPSHAAFLVAEGGTHPWSLVSVEGIGVERMRDIWWRAVTTYVAPRARFRDFAEATRVAAEDLYGKGSREAVTVVSAWRAVGVLR